MPRGCGQRVGELSFFRDFQISANLATFCMAAGKGVSLRENDRHMTGYFAQLSTRWRKKHLFRYSAVSGRINLQHPFAESNFIGIFAKITE